MPSLKTLFLTNVPANKIPVDFVENINSVLSKSLGKSKEEFISVVASDCQIAFGGGSKLPCATAILESIGDSNLVRHKLAVREISEFVTKEIGVDSNRFFITIYDLNKSNVGLHGTTVAELEK